MKSKFICILLFSLFCSCGIKQYVNNTEKTETFFEDLRMAINKRKSGVYVYPNLASKFTMKRGNFEGEFVFRHKYFPDTLFYAVFENNKPKGYFINMTYKLAHRRPDYFRFLHNELDRKISVDVLGEKKNIEQLEGKGTFNENGQKEGFWIDPNYRGGYKNPQGFYKNGLKHGHWDEINAKGTYVNGLRDGFWELESHSTGDLYVEKGFFKNDLQVGEWVIECNGKMVEKIFYKKGVEVKKVEE